jgi:ubiquitin carboxyl-terminal hydrolase L5
VEVARPHIQERIARYSQSEIRFNLLAVIRSRLQGLEERLGAARGRSEAAELASREGGAQGEGLAGSRSELEAARAEAAAEVEAATAALQAEQAKRRAWHDENVRRRHNYIPFLFHFLKTLAEKKQLKPLIERARELQQAP